MPGVGSPGQGQPGGQGFQMPSAQQIEEAKKRFESMTPEQQQQEMQKLRQQFENSMTPEQREQMRQRFQNMTPEQQEQMRQQRRSSRGEGGGRGPSGGRSGADSASGQPQGGQ